MPYTPDIFLPIPPQGDRYLATLNEAIKKSVQAVRLRLENLVVDTPTTTFSVVTDVDFATSKKKTRSLTITEGVVTAVGAESGWV